MTTLKPVAKAIVALIVCAAAYLVGVLTGDQTLADVTVVQWLGLVVFTGTAFGITYAVPNTPTPTPKRGLYREQD